MVEKIKETVNGWGLTAKILAAIVSIIIILSCFVNVVNVFSDKVTTTQLSACERQIKQEMEKADEQLEADINIKLIEQNRKIEALLETVNGLQRVTIINQEAIKYSQDAIKQNQHRIMNNSRQRD